jgi:hypothetical protein
MKNKIVGLLIIIFWILYLLTEDVIVSMILGGLIGFNFGSQFDK